MSAPLRNDDHPDVVYDHTGAVVGPGAVGLAVAGLLREVGHDVVLCGRPGGRPPGDEIVVTEGEQVRTHPVGWAEDPAQVGVARCVVIATTIQDPPAAWPWLDALAGRDTLVIVAQNGVEHHDRLPPGAWRAVVLALVYINAERESPGRVRMCRAALALAALEEAAADGRAEGAALQADAAVVALQRLQGLAADATSSMLQDREAGRPLEPDGLTGAVVRLAGRHGSDVPVVRTPRALAAAAR